MKFNLAKQEELHKAWEYLDKLTSQESMVNITKVNPNRTLLQNNYLHLLLGIFGSETGYTIEEAKTLFKRYNKDIFVYKKNSQVFTRSSADLDTKELTIAIDKFKMYAAENGIHLPDPDESEKLRYYENQAEMNSYL